MLAHAAASACTLEAFSFVENPASARVLEKAGFTDLGVIVRGYPERGGRRNVRRFSLRLTPILRARWIAAASSRPALSQYAAPQGRKQ